MCIPLCFAAVCSFQNHNLIISLLKILYTPAAPPLPESPSSSPEHSRPSGFHPSRTPRHHSFCLAFPSLFGVWKTTGGWLLCLLWPTAHTSVPYPPPSLLSMTFPEDPHAVASSPSLPLLDFFHDTCLHPGHHLCVCIKPSPGLDWTITSLKLWAYDAIFAEWVQVPRGVAQNGAPDQQHPYPPGTCGTYVFSGSTPELLGQKLWGR